MAAASAIKDAMSHDRSRHHNGQQEETIASAPLVENGHMSNGNGHSHSPLAGESHVTNRNILAPTPWNGSRYTAPVKVKLKGLQLPSTTQRSRSPGIVSDLPVITSDLHPEEVKVTEVVEPSPTPITVNNAMDKDGSKINGYHHQQIDNKVTVRVEDMTGDTDTVKTRTDINVQSEKKLLPKDDNVKTVSLKIGESTFKQYKPAYF